MLAAPFVQPVTRGTDTMNRALITSAALAFLLALGQPVSAQDLATSVVGVWKMKNFESVEVESKKVLRPFGENPAAYYVFTKGGQVHLCHLLI